MGWYVRRDDSVSGPFEKADILKRIADGNISRRAMVREDASDEWCPIETSIFERAFGASNPYVNSNLTTTHRSASPDPADLAGPALWLAAGAVAIFYSAVMVGEAPSSGKEGGAATAELIGRIIGSLLVPLFIVGVASAWKRNRTQKRRLTIFVIVGLTFAIMPLALRSFVTKTANSGPPWTYRSDEHGFSVVLPSSSWKKSGLNQTHVVDFANVGFLPMLAGVLSVKSESLEEFRASASSFGSTFAKRTPTGPPPTSQEGQTTSGNPYVLVQWRDRAGTEEKLLYMSASQVHLQAKGLTVTVLFEGQSRMVGEAGQSAENAEFEKAVKAISASID